MDPSGVKLTSDVGGLSGPKVNTKKTLKIKQRVAFLWMIIQNAQTQASPQYCGRSIISFFSHHWTDSEAFAGQVPEPEEDQTHFRSPDTPCQPKAVQSFSLKETDCDSSGSLFTWGN
jgi:hypothetical protein